MRQGAAVGACNCSFTMLPAHVTLCRCLGDSSLFVAKKHRLQILLPKNELFMQHLATVNCSKRNGSAAGGSRTVNISEISSSHVYLELTNSLPARVLHPPEQLLVKLPAVQRALRHAVPHLQHPDRPHGTCRAVRIVFHVHSAHFVSRLSNQRSVRPCVWSVHNSPCLQHKCTT